MLALFLVGAPTAAQATVTYCQKFITSQNYIRSINGETIDELFPEQDWQDNVYRSRDRNMNVANVAKTFVFVLIRRASWVGYALTPSRAEAATLTGAYVRSPDAFARFLQLPSSQACHLLTLPGAEADTLRALTHQIWLMIRAATRP